MAMTSAVSATPSLAELERNGLDRELLVRAYRNLLLTRGVEERGHILYKQGKVPGSFYTGRGNEAAAVAVAMAMRRDDVGAPTQRDLGVHIARGLEPWRILAQYLGRADGPARGRDGNVHMGDPRLGHIAMVSHLPAMLPVVVGCALAFRIRGEDRVAIGWFGEGSSARGDAHEAMTLAGTRRLPVVFVCDNNQFAYSTPMRLEVATPHVADRAYAYGFPGVVVDGTDFTAVYAAAREAIERARSGEGPTLLECVTLRLEGHGAHDDARYVPRELFEAYADKDPLDRHRRLLVEAVGWSEEEDAALRAEIKAELDEAVRRAEASPLPDPDTLLDGVYAAPGETVELGSPAR
jgi:pyruvate dehydrogenase E1 component alpha subunit